MSVSKDSRQTAQEGSLSVEAFAPPVDWQRVIFMVMLGSVGLVWAFNVSSTWSSLLSWLGGSALTTLAVVAVVGIGIGGVVKWTGDGAIGAGQGFR